MPGEQKSTSIIEGRELTKFPQLGIVEITRTIWLVGKGRFDDAKDVFSNKIVDRSIQNQLTTAVSDHFPMRIGFIRLARGFDLAMVRAAYALLPDSAIPMGTRSEIYITKDQATVIKGLLENNEENQAQLDERIQDLSTLAGNYPDKHVYVFYFERLAYSDLDPRLPYFPNLDGGRLFEHLKQELPETITLGTLEISSVDEFNEYYYHTDHHWNIRGAWNAYQEMYKMVCQDFPDISPMNDSITFKTYPDLLFLGTYARDTLFPFKPETFEIGEVSLPNYSVYTRDYVIKYNLSDEYNSGIYSKDPYVSRYAEYFGANSPFLMYSFDNHASKNLLLIGTSYKIPIQPWIASHYQLSYFVNLANYPDFSLSGFLEDHQVDDIIILADMNELLDPTLSIKP